MVSIYLSYIETLFEMLEEDFKEEERSIVIFLLILAGGLLLLVVAARYNLILATLITKAKSLKGFSESPL